MADENADGNALLDFAMQHARKRLRTSLDGEALLSKMIRSAIGLEEQATSEKK